MKQNQTQGPGRPAIGGTRRLLILAPGQAAWLAESARKQRISQAQVIRSLIAAAMVAKK